MVVCQTFFRNDKGIAGAITTNENDKHNRYEFVIVESIVYNSYSLANEAYFEIALCKLVNGLVNNG